MSLESCYGHRVIRDVVRRFFIEKGFRPRRTRRGYRMPRARYLLSYYDESAALVGVFYDSDTDTVLEHRDIKGGRVPTLRFTAWDRDLLLSLLQNLLPD